MSFVTADVVVGHEAADDNAEGSGDEEGDGESDLFDWGFVVDGVGGLHHYVFVGNGECVIYIRHGLGICGIWGVGILGFRNWGF